MADVTYAYSAQLPRNPLRYLLALWRALRDPSNTDAVAIVELGLLRSRFARRFTKLDGILEALASNPRTAPRLRVLRPCTPIDLAALAKLPAGTLGRVFADHCGTRNLNPNLVDFPTATPLDLVIHQLYATHDLWHVVTGWGNDLTGEMGVGGFYSAQLGAPPFFAILTVLLLLNAVFFQPRTLRDRMDAFAAGYEAGRRADPLFGVDWPSLFVLPLAEVRARLGLEGGRIVGAGVAAA